jgi:Protein of unknown function (DUF3341)
MTMDATPKGRTYVLGLFPTGAALVKACHEVRKAGYSDLDTHSPYPLHGGDEALGLKRSAVPKVALAGALTGMFGGMGMMVWMNAFNWPLNVGGRPPLSPLAYIPITFETTVLLTSLSIFFGLLIMMRLPQPYHAVFELEAFRSAVTDGFWLSVAEPSGSDGKEASRVLESVGATQVGVVEESVE